MGRSPNRGPKWCVKGHVNVLSHSPIILTVLDYWTLQVVAQQEVSKSGNYSIPFYGASLVVVVATSSPKAKILMEALISGPVTPVPAEQ